MTSEEAEILDRLRSLLPTREDQSPPALVFHGVRGTNCQSQESPSWYNPHEAVQTTLYLQSLYNAGLTPDQCGIITPYQAQVWFRIVYFDKFEYKITFSCFHDKNANWYDRVELAYLRKEPWG